MILILLLVYYRKGKRVCSVGDSTLNLIGLIFGFQIWSVIGEVMSDFWGKGGERGRKNSRLLDRREWAQAAKLYIDYISVEACAHFFSVSFSLPSSLSLPLQISCLTFSLTKNFTLLLCLSAAILSSILHAFSLRSLPLSHTHHLVPATNASNRATHESLGSFNIFLLIALTWFQFTSFGIFFFNQNPFLFIGLINLEESHFLYLL